MATISTPTPTQATAATTLPSTETLLFKLAQQFVICSLCNKRFQEPKSLLCSHSFCRGCLLTKISPRARNIACPSCKRSTPMPSKGISGLKDNLFMNQLLQETQLQEKEMAAIVEGDWPICGICAVDQERQASNRCIDCNQYLCKECCTTHRQYNFGALQGHSIVSLDDIQAGRGSLHAGSVIHGNGRHVAECSQHPGESAHFYCESCGENICRDCTVLNHTKPEHTYVEARDAAARRRKTMRLKLLEVRDCMDRYRRILDQTGHSAKNARKKCTSIKDQIKRRADEEVARIRETEGRMLKQVDAYESSVLADVPEESEKDTDQDQINIENLLQVMHQITEESRDDSFLLLYQAVKSKVKQLGDECIKLESKPIPTSQQVPILLHFDPVPKSTKSLELGVITERRTQASEWHLHGKFGREGQGKGELRFAKGVAATADGNIAIADDTNRRVTVYSKDGRYQFMLAAESKKYGNLMHVPSDVAVSITGHFIVVDRTALVKIFDRRGQFLNEFCVLEKHRSAGRRSRLGRSLRGSFGRSTNSRKRDVDLCCVAVDSRNQILVGDRGRGVVSVHESNGVYIRTIKLTNKPWCMTIGRNDLILVGDYISGTIEAVTSNGELLFSIDPVLDGKRLKAAGVCTDAESIFVSTHSNKPGYGAVLQYTKEGKMLGCVVKSLWNPLGMDFLPIDGSLIIADVTSVKKYLPAIPPKR